MNLAERPRVLVTGATGGLGAATARAMVDRGWHVVVGGRDAERVARQVADLGGPDRASAFVADLGELAAVRAAAGRLAAGSPLRAVVANAGTTLSGDHVSADGYEQTFAVNVLAHHLLLALLAGALEERARAVVVSSGTHLPGHRIARLFRVPPPRWVGAQALARPDHRDHLPPGPVRYSTSKLGSVLLARALQARLRTAGRDVDVFAIDPGLMLDTDLAREAPRPARAVMRALTAPMAAVPGFRASATSARHVADLLTRPDLAGRGFAYLDGDHERPPSPEARRDDLADALWAQGCALVDLDAQDTVLPLV